MSDPFDTHTRRQVILDAWRASPTRFREDANAEEDLVRGAYADRLLVELVQNAADSAAQAGVPGTLRFRLIQEPECGWVLSAANTGAPLDAAGVDTLTALRASAKRDGTTAGRFGVGFSAVLAVSDAPELRSRTGGIRFSAEETRRLVATVPHLAEEMARRSGAVPVTRLPWPAPTPPAEGFDAEVWLPLRDADAVKAVADALAEFDPALLLAFPELAVVDLNGRVIRRSSSGSMITLDEDGVPTRWRLVRREGELPGDLLADRPVEERVRTAWSMLAAVPVTTEGKVAPPAVRQVIHAPTPSDEPLSLPVRLIGTFPLDVGRRRVPSGPLTAWLAERAGEVIADLIIELADHPEVLQLAPAPGLATAPLDAAIRDACAARLRQRAWLPVVTPDGSLARDSEGAILPVEPGRAVSVPDPLVLPLADTLQGLLPEGWWNRTTAALLGDLGVRRLGIADLVPLITGLERSPQWWRRVYAALEATGLDLADREALAGLPVPLLDGRTAVGPADTLLPPEEELPAAVVDLGLRVVHPDAVHPLLERLGATPATAEAILTDPRVREAVLDAVQEGEPEDLAELATTVLSLVSAARLHTPVEEWLTELPLPAADGDWVAAADLILPDGQLVDLLVPSAPLRPVAPDWVARWGAAALTGVGVMDDFHLLEESMVDLADLEEIDLPAIDEWAEVVRATVGETEGAYLERLLAVRDLEWVRDDRWAEALQLLIRQPTREALVAPCSVVLPDGGRVLVPAYTRWWLGRQPLFSGRRPAELRTRDAVELEGLYDPAPVDSEVARLLGARSSLDDVLADRDAAVDLLDRLADPSRWVKPELLVEVYARLAAALAEEEIDLPGTVRVAPDRVAPASEVVVLDHPWLLDRLGNRYAISGGTDPVAVADLLELPLLSELPEKP